MEKKDAKEKRQIVRKKHPQSDLPARKYERIPGSRGVGRYPLESIEAFCMSMANGSTLRQACKDNNLCLRTIMYMLVRRKNEYEQTVYDMYMKAREVQALLLADEIIGIADGPGAHNDAKEMVMRDSLRFNARKWLLSKVLQPIYGDKITQEVTGKDGGAIETKMIVDAPRQERSVEEFIERKKREQQCKVSIEKL